MYIKKKSPLLAHLKKSRIFVFKVSATFITDKIVKKENSPFSFFCTFVPTILSVIFMAKETNIIVQKQENPIELSIIQSIHEIRGVRVILDFDLAKRYEVETRALKQAVRRNIERFEGDDFMFELTKNEVDTLSRSQIVILNNGRGSNIKYKPFAFTELGVAMLSSVLNSKKAIDMNRKIMRAFVAIRQYVLNYADLKHEITDFIRETNINLDKTNTRLGKTEVKVDDVFKMLSKLFEEKKAIENRDPIGFNADRYRKQKGVLEVISD